MTTWVVTSPGRRDVGPKPLFTVREGVKVPLFLVPEVFPEVGSPDPVDTEFFEVPTWFSVDPHLGGLSENSFSLVVLTHVELGRNSVVCALCTLLERAVRRLHPPCLPWKVSREVYRRTRWLLERIDQALAMDTKGSGKPISRTFGEASHCLGSRSVPGL